VYINQKFIDETEGRIEGNYRCYRCSATGNFITHNLNGKPVGPGGKCFKCGGKRYHTQADRKRNYGHAMNYVPT